MAWIGNVSNIKGHGDVKAAIDYVVRDSKTQKEGVTSSEIGEHYVYSTVPIQDVKDTDIIKDTWSSIRKQYGKDDKILVHHFVQSLNPEHGATPEESFAIAKELAAKIFGSQGFEYIVSTHIDKDVVHNHIIVNNVSTTTGRKYQHNTRTYMQMRKDNIDICRLHGFNAIDTGINFMRPEIRDISGLKTSLAGRYKTGYDIMEDEGRVAYVKTEAYKRWKTAEDSHKKIIKRDINDAIKFSDSWDTFLQNMRKKGYSIDDKTKSGADKKYVTYKPPGAERGKRDRNLGDKYAKIEIIRRIEKRLEREMQHEEYLQKKREGTLDYQKKKVDKEYYRYLAMRRRSIKQKTRISIIRINCRYYKRRHFGIRLIRIGRLEQSCMEQYMRYQSALFEYDRALQESKTPPYSELEHRKIQRDIQDIIDRIGTAGRYGIVSIRDAKTAINELQLKRNAKLQKISEMEERISRYDEKIYLFQELKRYAPVQYEYDRREGKEKEVYQIEHMVELENYAMIKRSIGSDLGNAAGEKEYVTIKEKLLEQIETARKDITELDQEKGKIQEVLNNYFPERDEKKER